jgi:sulfur carrier protein
MSDDTVQVRLNGRDTALAAGTTVAAVVESLAPTSRRIAVERNGVIVPRSQWPDCAVQAGDRLEIVGAVGGG